MRETADFAKTRQDNHDDSTKIATTPMAANTVATRSVADAVGSRSLDNIAVWANEGGSGGEVIR
jgi:hypothetical protein